MEIKGSFLSKQSKRGITLIALVVTIVVLLILAGVSISMLSGENGIISQAQEAKNNTEAAKLKEELNLKITEGVITKYTIGDETLPPVFDPLNVVGINKLIEDENSIKFHLVLLENGKYYNAEYRMTEQSSSFENVLTVTGLREEAKLLFKLLNGDVDDIEFINDNSFKYNGINYQIIQNRSTNYIEMYVEKSEDTTGLEVLEIHNCDEMIAFAERVNGGENFSNYIVKLKADLDFEGAAWDSIGYAGLRSNGNKMGWSFSGIFDGENHVIRGLTIADNRYEAGIFGNNQGTIKNLHVEDFNITKTTSYLCYVADIAASNGGIVENCSANITFTFSSSSSQYSCYVGGIVGSGGTVRNCISYGIINASGSTANVGGIAGEATNISQTINYAQLVGNSDCKYLAGIVGENGEIVEKSINYGIISTVKGAAAGVCGFTRGIIKECANKGTITSISGGGQPYPEVAGICNRIFYGGSIESCYNTGTLESPTSKYYYAYGIVGNIDEEDASIKNCYSSCTITDTQYGSERGAFPYYNNKTYTGILNCYYNSEICTAPENYAQAYTTLQMKETSFASLLGSAFKTDTNTVNNGYPIFSWE